MNWGLNLFLIILRVYWNQAILKVYIRTILRATSMMITNTEMTNWIIEKFSGSGGIRTHDLRVTSLLLYQLRYRALGAVREWIPIYMAHVIPVTSCKLTISPGWSQCFDSILQPSSGQHRIPPEPLNFSIIQLVISVLVIIIDFEGLIHEVLSVIISHLKSILPEMMEMDTVMQ